MTLLIPIRKDQVRPFRLLKNIKNVKEILFFEHWTGGQGWTRLYPACYYPTFEFEGKQYTQILMLSDAIANKVSLESYWSLDHRIAEAKRYKDRTNGFINTFDFFYDES